MTVVTPAPAPGKMTPGWHATHAPDRPAIVMADSGEVVTYAQLEDRSARFARALRARGLATGDHLAILLDNNREYLETTWAAQRSGLYYTAINRHLHAAEVQYILDDCGADALVTDGSMADVVAGLNLSAIAVRISARGELSDFDAYPALLDEHPPGPLTDECEGREMLYSSGTTGRPKGIRKPLPATALGDPAAAPVQIAQGLLVAGNTNGAVYLSPAPLYHGAPLVFSMSWHRLGPPWW